MLARGAFAALFVAIALLVVVVGLFRTVALLAVCVGGAVLTIAALYAFLVNRGALRWISLAVVVIIPLAVIAAIVNAGLFWALIPIVVLLAAAVWWGRAALVRDGRVPPSPEIAVPPPAHPILLMNPNSGGGKVGQFDLIRRAEALGAEVVLIQGPGHVDVAELARQAVARGADLLGAAGGDGTQALVAQVAAQNGLPFLVISAGTRNHFALDLGIDRDDPVRSLSALTDGVEIRVDLGEVGGHPFVNNASFGVYAEVVRSPAYRADKVRTVLDLLPDVLAGKRGAPLVARAENTTVMGPQAVLVSNGPYRTDDLAGLGRRAQLDSGLLGVVTISVRGARQAVGLFNRAHNRGMVRLEASEVVVDSEAAEIAVGVDGESIMFPTPVKCRIQPGALRVRLPRDRPGVPPLRPAWDWLRLWELTKTSARRQ
nr:diacylglycerol kinase family protein [Aldersonia kunmingensis]